MIEGVVGRGHPVMRAHFPRCYVDVNREPYELDPRMFDGRLPSFANTRSMRVAGGLGTVARVVGDAQEIYDQRISVAEAMRRIDGLYKPYHRSLRRMFMRLHPANSAPPFWSIATPCRRAAGGRDERPRADLVLGDRYGTSCVPLVAETIEHCLHEFGYVVSRNKPYAGGFITEHYGNPATGLHAIQLEINRALYMDERRYEALGIVRTARRRIRDFGRSPGGHPHCRRVTALPCSGGIGVENFPNRPPFTTAVEKIGERRPKEKRAAHLPGAAQVPREKRPRRATVTGESLSLPHCKQHTPRRTKRKCC